MSMKHIPIQPYCLLSCVAAAAILAFASASARASLLAYEGFNPPPAVTTNIDGIATGTGFAGPWTNSAGDDIAHGALINCTANNNFLAFPANVYFPGPAGGMAQNGDGWASGVVVRPLSMPIDLSADGVYYISWLNTYGPPPPSAARNYDARVYIGREPNAATGEPGLRIMSGVSYDVDGAASNELAITVNPGATNITWWEYWPHGSFGSSGQQTGYYMCVAQIQTYAAGGDTVNLRAYIYTPGGTNQVDTDPANVVWDVTYTDNIGTMTGLADHLGLAITGAALPSIGEIRLGTTWSDVVDTTVPATIAFLSQPVSQAVAITDSAHFSVVMAGGSGSPTYQWQKQVNGTFVNLSDGGNISGSTTSQLTITNVQPSDATNYLVRVNNTTNSAVASLTVVGNPQTSIELHAAIVINGVVGFHYQVQYSSALTGGTWQLLQDIPSLPTTPYLVYDPTAATYASRFYRAVIVP